MDKLAGDLLLGLKFVKLEILSTSFIDFLYEELEESRSRSLELKFVKLKILSTSFIDFLYEELGELRSVSATPLFLFTSGDTVNQTAQNKH